MGLTATGAGTMPAPMSTSRPFDPRAYQRFRLTRLDWDDAARTARLGYELLPSGTADRLAFEEVVSFEEPPGGWEEPADGPGLARALTHLHVAAGTSYYKVAAPPVVEVPTALSAEARQVHHHLYDDGLREFAVTNGLPVPRPVRIDAPGSSGPVAGPGAGPRAGLVVPVGGGKDSMVVVEALRDLRPRLFAVDPHPLVVELAGQAGLELLVAHRRLDPSLAALNRSGALNGHVPVTAIVSLVALAGAFVFGYDTVVMSVERSASEATRTVDGTPVNHQYSKSLDFERLLASLARTGIHPALTYGSALRPYSELAIARAFAGASRYHRTFCSCNTAFRRDEPTGGRWCGSCPKCRFVALVLAPFAGRDVVAGIIGRDLLDDPGEIAGFAELLSPADKPFECVGERRESAAAITLLAASGDSSAVVRALAGRAAAVAGDDAVADVLTADRSLDFPDAAVAEAVARFIDGSAAGPGGRR